MSYAKIFDPTTFIAENQISFEDETKGMEAKMLFFEKSKDLNKQIDYKKESPFVRFIQKCKDNNIVPKPVGLVHPRNLE